MGFTPQQLSDLEEIKQLKSRYCRATDLCDVAMLRALFTPDVTVDYRGGAYTAICRGVDEMLDFLLNAHHSEMITMHHAHLPDIAFTGPDSAEGTWYCEDFHISLDRREITMGCLIYRDRYVRRDGVWKISSTSYDRVWEAFEPLRDGIEITAHSLARAGLPRDQRRDIGHLLHWKDRTAA
ncbi:nuclear transport factor 2 family protein [Flavisphingomonas formosensis]|uniref:nuclear transport factor 2 family protein n=1 Tax=Flavisphingomonas formosensis TaxID=861534 RepID=UPI0012F9DFF7|nr:nuclear transport factor 2 family protein [Sphingomonas formosensis]